MKRQYLILAFLVGIIKGYAQVQPSVKYEKKPISNEKTDLSKVDTLELWNYSFDDSHKSKSTDSIHYEGSISFRRIRPLNDNISFRVYGRQWSPAITYQIFNLSDSAYCKRESWKTLMITSCVPPDVGGDILIVGKYIFLNTNVCLNCRKYDTGVDYCRPVINFVISKVDKNKASTLDEVFNQFPIKRTRIWNKN